MEKDTASRQHILVTGASGFIGRALCLFLREKGWRLRAAVRSAGAGVQGADETVRIGGIDGRTDWAEALSGVDAVVHLAARVHVMRDTSEDPLGAFRRINVKGTEHLAREALRAGVKRFVFISSIKVNGEGRERPYTELDPPAPEDAYGISKKEAEDLLRHIARETGLEVVILRLPLVYGPGVKANFKSLIKIVRMGLPLPFKGVSNKRSFVYVGNVVDAIKACLIHPLAAGETFFLSDGEDVSTPELLRLIARAMNKKIFLFALGMKALKVVGKMTGMSQEIDRLTGSLTVDARKIRKILGWAPPFTLQQGIAKTVLEKQ